MEKSKLKLESHSILPETQAVEVWYEGEMIATVYGSDGPGVRVISKHPMEVIRGGLPYPLKVIEIRVQRK